MPRQLAPRTVAGKVAATERAFRGVAEVINHDRRTASVRRERQWQFEGDDQIRLILKLHLRGGTVRLVSAPAFNNGALEYHGEITWETNGESPFIGFGMSGIRSAYTPSEVIRQFDRRVLALHRKLSWPHKKHGADASSPKELVHELKGVLDEALKRASRQ